MASRKPPTGVAGRHASPAGAIPGYVKKANARYDRHDHFYRRAKEEGFVARSIYKLDEIDREYKLIKKGDVVVDLGCAPGSWMQYVEERIGDHGRGFGIDLLPVKTAFSDRIRTIQGDAFAVTLEQLTDSREGELRPIDIVLSDMAPNTTGIRSVDAARSYALCERALEVAARLLRPGGHFVVKVLEGGEQKAFIEQCKEVFANVKIKRPKSTREGSTETFVIGLHRKPPAP